MDFSVSPNHLRKNMQGLECCFKNKQHLSKTLCIAYTKYCDFYVHGISSYFALQYAGSDILRGANDES